eukprot:gb/GEZN01022239.1/.p1 GENE.gb/GEZN01022239.1/~~gb/GEZN01022239.1/.p1  ORF type:complete len:124 (+),score=30.28 gb/GEZN01022239.1/:134-505(+)
MATDSLTWAIINQNSCFLIKRDGARFSTDPMNLMNKSCFKYSGLANKEALSVSLVDKKVVVKKKSKSSNKPNALTEEVDIAELDKGFYRRDLTKYAKARAGRLADPLAGEKEAAPLKKRKTKA